jgi:predicted RNase H-like HicB family nuclease
MRFIAGQDEILGAVKHEMSNFRQKRRKKYIYEGGIMIYRIIIEKGEDFGYITHCPAIPGCHSQGVSMEDAIENTRDAIIGCLEVID